jgi:hypothetical protein
MIINRFYLMSKLFRKLPLTVIFLSAFLVLLAVGMQSFEVAEANFFVGPILSIQSPSSSRVYTNTTVPLDLLATVRQTEIVHFTYSLDNVANVTLTNITRTGTVGGYDFHATAVLPNLSQGNHTLAVYSEDSNGTKMATSTEFRIDSNYKSPFLLLSPKNTTYLIASDNRTDVDLAYTCNERILWSDYHLWQVGKDPQIREAAVSGNLTLADLPVGSYKLMVNGWTVTGPIDQTIYFSVADPEPFPTALVAVVSIIVIAVAGAVLLIYRKKNLVQKP